MGATYQSLELFPPGKQSTSWVLQSVIQVSFLESKWTLVVPERSLDDFWQTGCLKNAWGKLHINFQISSYLESGRTPGFSRASSKCHPWSLWGRWRFLRGVLVVFEMVDASRIHPGSYISIFKFLPSWKVVQLLGSPERHPSVILGVYEDAGGSWEEFWWFLTWWMSQGYFKEAAYQFSDLYLSGKCIISYVSPERHHGV